MRLTGPASGVGPGRAGGGGPAHEIAALLLDGERAQPPPARRGPHGRPIAHPARRRRLLGGLALALLVLPVGLVVLTGDAGPPADLTHVRSWVTTPDERKLLAEQQPAAFSDLGSTASLTVTVDPTRTYQAIDGFGAAITDSSAAVLYRLHAQTRDAALVKLFDPVSGAGLSYLRQPMGASDFVDGNPYTYDDVATGTTDYAMAHFSIQHDEEQILPLLRRAKALNPRLRIIASPWSAPAWMKTTGSLIGGSLIDDPRIYRAYASYFVRFLRAYAAAGVPVNAVTVQNEPQVAPTDYPGMVMPAAQEARFISELGPALRQAGLRVSILAYDHNWASSGGAAPATSAPPINPYVERVLSDRTAARWVGGVAFHCYAGQADAQAEVHRSFPDEPIVLSECSGYRTTAETQASTFARSLGAVAQLLIAGTRNWARAILTWNVALGPGSGPHRGGCAMCTGLVRVGPGDAVTRNAEYYALASISRVARPGAIRIASTSFPVAGDKGGLITAAFWNRDGSVGLLADNRTAAPRRFAVRVGDRSFTTTLAGGALGAYLWPGAASPVDDLVLLASSQMKATASPTAPTDPCCTGDVASQAVDDAAGTRWSTGHPQQPGDYLQVDLGEPRKVARVVLDSGTAPGDAPSRWALYAGDSPASFGRPVAEGAGIGQLTTITLDGVDARYLRVATTGRASAWWSVAEIRVYVHR